MKTIISKQIVDECVTAFNEYLPLSI